MPQLPQESFSQMVLKTMLGLGMPVVFYFLLSLIREGAKRPWKLMAGPSPLAHFVKLSVKAHSPTLNRDYLGLLLSFITFILVCLPLTIMTFFGPVSAEGGPFRPQIFPFSGGLFFIFLVLNLVPISLLMDFQGLHQIKLHLRSIRQILQIFSFQLAFSLICFSVLFFYWEWDVDKVVLYQKEHSYGLFMVPGPLGCVLYFISLLFLNTHSSYEWSNLKMDFYHAGERIPPGKYLLGLFFRFMITFELVWLLVMLFFGGYLLPWGDDFVLRKMPSLMPFLQTITIFSKMLLVYALIHVLLKLLPRFKLDQLLGLFWKWIFPLSLLNFLITMIYIYFHPRML